MTGKAFGRDARMLGWRVPGGLESLLLARTDPAQ